MMRPRGQHRVDQVAEAFCVYTVVVGEKYQGFCHKVISNVNTKIAKRCDFGSGTGRIYRFVCKKSCFLKGKHYLCTPKVQGISYEDAGARNIPTHN